MDSSEYKRSEYKKFGFEIGLKFSELQLLLKDIDGFYREREEIKLDKETNLPKTFSNGTVKKRTIQTTTFNLKMIQKKIKTKYLEKVALPKEVHGGVKTKSNISNAKAHQGNIYQFTTDLKDFYPNITSQMVYDALIYAGFPTHQAHLITRLTTWKHRLPQGTPTSTHIANIVFLKTDFELLKFCQDNGLTYTRYVDDLTFSAQTDFKSLIPSLLNIITVAGYQISYRKTKYGSDQVITGIKVLLNKLEAPKHIKERALQEIEEYLKQRPYARYEENIRRFRKTVSRK